MQLEGISVAGVETCIEVPNFGLLLDIGVCSASAPNHPRALVSHGHLDHIGAIALHAARRALRKMGESTYFVPPAIAGDAEALFNAAGALDGQAIPRRIVPLEPGQDFALDGKRWVRPFATFHRVPSQGYTVWERRHRLRAEFKGKPPRELAELRRRGVGIEDGYDVPLLSFTGDTRVEVLERVPELLETELLVVEATFLDDRVAPAEAREMGHIHLDELVARAELLTARRVVLHHFSARYSRESALRIASERLPDSLRERVHVFAPGQERDAAEFTP
jgi:ribonuclease Z